MTCEPSCTESSMEIESHELSALCRLCASKMDNMTSIFCSSDNGTEILTQVRDCLPIAIRDKDFSKLICTLCKDNLKKFHEFRNNVLKTNEIFKCEENVLRPQNVNEQSIELSCRICSACNQVLEDETPGAKYHEKCEKSADTKPEIRETVLNSAFQCEFCDRCYVDVKSVKIHKASHVGEKPFVCWKCDVHYSTHKQLMKHRDQQCKSSETANANDKATKIPKYFSCLHCDTIFMYSKSMNIHQRSCSSITQPINRFRCHCGDRFMDSKGLDEHNSREINKKWQCQRCLVSFGSICALRRHKKQRHVKQFTCADCGKEFLQKSHLSTHVITHMAEPSIKCRLCEKLFSTSSRLRNHMKFHNNPRPFRCNVCDKAFKRFSARKIHMTIHSGEKAFKCDACEKAFKRKADLRKHKKTRHQVNCLVLYKPNV